MKVDKTPTKRDNSGGLSESSFTSPSSAKSSDGVVKMDSVSKLSEKAELNQTVITPKSNSKGKTPPSSEEKSGASGTPGKPKSKRRLAANFSFGGAS